MNEDYEMEEDYFSYQEQNTRSGVAMPEDSSFKMTQDADESYKSNQTATTRVDTTGSGTLKTSSSKKSTKSFMSNPFSIIKMVKNQRKDGASPSIFGSSKAIF